MQVITAIQGRRKGKANIKETLLTMQPGESWITTTDEVSSIYARSVAHRVSNEIGRWYTVSHKVADYERITITRVK